MVNVLYADQAEISVIVKFLALKTRLLTREIPEFLLAHVLTKFKQGVYLWMKLAFRFHCIMLVVSGCYETTR